MYKQICEISYLNLDSKIRLILLYMAEHNELGVKGEKLAKAHLLEKNHRILCTNYRFKHLELDIISFFKDTLVITEVKTRSSKFMAGPEKTISKKKQKDIIKATNEYVLEKAIDAEIRFDVISIILNDKGCEVEHIEDAFYPTL